MILLNYCIPLFLPWKGLKQISQLFIPSTLQQKQFTRRMLKSKHSQFIPLWLLSKLKILKSDCQFYIIIQSSQNVRVLKIAFFCWKSFMHIAVLLLRNRRKTILNYTWKCLQIYLRIFWIFSGKHLICKQKEQKGIPQRQRTTNISWIWFYLWF